MARERSVQEKTTMEILAEIRDLRNAELKAQGKTNISVIMVEFLGQGEETGKRFFRVIEHQEFEDKPTQTLEKYYTYDGEKPQLIAVKSPEAGEILPIGMQGNERQSWNIEKTDIEECIKARQREYEQELKMMAKELGIKEEEIAQLSMEELTKKIEEAENAEKTENDEQAENAQEEGSQELTEDQVNNIGGVRNEVQLDIPVDSRGTLLRDVLKLEGFTSIIPEPSSKLPSLATKGEDTENPRVPFVLVGRRQDGTIATLPTNRVKLYRGSNTEATKINDADSVEHSADEDCIFEVVGSNKRLIVNQTDPYGIPNVYLGQSTRTNDGNVAQKLQDRYDGTERTDVEVRQLFNANKGTNQIQEMENEAGTHFDENCPTNKDEKIEGNNAYTLVDGEKNTGIHLHLDSVVKYDGMEAKMSILAKTFGSCIADEEVQKFLEKINGELAENEVNIEQAIKKVIDEKNEEIIQQVDEPEKVVELMKRANVEEPRLAIRALELAEGDVDVALEIYEEQIRNMQDEF